MIRAWWKTVASLAVLGLFAVPAAAQTGGLSVRVVDGSGAPLPGATVTLSNDRGYVGTTSEICDRAGVVEFPVLRAGVGYRVEVQLPGFSTVRVVDLRVRIQQTLDVPVQLSSELVERVEAIATREVVSIEESQASTRFSDEFVRDLPVAGRFYQNVLTLAPGVEDSDGDGNPTVHGSRSRDFKAVVGGLSNVDPLTGQWMSRVNPNSIEELEVITAGAGVEFGRAQGGYARVIQKQGSNAFEGVFDFHWRTSRFDRPETNSRIEEPVEFATYQPGFQLSGPIIRDRLWYRLSHEFNFGEDPINLISELRLVKTRSATHSDQITWQASPRNKFALLFQADPVEIDNFGVSAFVSEEASQRRDFGGESLSLTWSAPYSPRLFVESRLGWQDLNVGIFPANPGVDNSCIIGLPAVEAAECFDAVLGRTTGSFARTQDDHRQRLTARTDLTAYTGRWLGVRHQIKTGLIIENERYFRFLDVRPSSRYFVVPSFTLDGMGNPIPPGGYLSTQVAVPQTTDTRATGVSWGVYLEDQVKPLDNLVLTLGLRYDREQIDANGSLPFDPTAESADFLQRVASGQLPSTAAQSAFTAYEGIGEFALQLAALLGVPQGEILSSLSTLSQESAFWNQERRAENIHLANGNAAPYLGVAWDPWGDGKTKLSAVASRHYNNLPLNVPLIENEPAIADITFIVDPRTRRLGRLESGVNAGLNVRTVDRDLRTPYQDELYLAMERELWAESSAKLSYVRRRYRDQLQDRDINRFTGDFGRCQTASGLDPRPIRPVTTQDDDYDPAFAPGDGIIDDCVGILEVSPVPGPMGRPQFLQRPDGLADLYIANPGWVDILLLGNFNSSDYDGWVLEFVRRQYRGWEMQFSYTFSESIGDGEDFLQQFGNDNSLLEDERGFQSDDRRHVVKLNGTTVTPWGVRLGAALSWRSGLPFSLLTEALALDAVPPPYLNLGAGASARPRQIYVDGSRNDQRNVSYWNLDLKATRELRLPRGMNLQLSAELFNLLDDQTYIVYNPSLGIGRSVNGENEAYLRDGRRWQFGVRVAF